MNASRQSIGPAAPDRGAVLAGVVGVVAEQMGIAPESIGEGDALVEDIGCDSLDVVEISMELEEQFDISIPEELSDQARTVGQITDGILGLLAGTASD
jgi:acyl carrier protein